MGCVLSNGSSGDYANRSLERLKLETRYTKVQHVKARRSTGVRQETETGNAKGHARARRSTGVRQELARGMKPEARFGVENNVIRKTGDGDDRAVDLKNKTEEDELVNGWPKWLVDNIPSHVLRNITPKSADSYVKIGQIGHGT